MQVLKFVVNIDSLDKVIPYEGFIYYTRHNSRYLYKCNSIFERIASFRLIGEINEFTIVSSRIFVNYVNDLSIYIYDMNLHLLFKVDSIYDEEIYHFNDDKINKECIYVESLKHITKLSLNGEKLTKYRHRGLLSSYHSIFNGYLFEMDYNTIKIYDSKLALYNTINLPPLACMIFHKDEIHVMHESIYHGNTSYKIYNKNNGIKEVNLPYGMKINSFISTNDEYLYVRTNHCLVIYKDNEIVGMTKGCNGLDIDTVFSINEAHYFKIYNCIYRLIDFNWNDYNSLDVSQRESIENWLDFRPLSPIHRDVALLFARELINTRGNT